MKVEQKEDVEDATNHHTAFYNDLLHTSESSIPNEYYKVIWVDGKIFHVENQLYLRAL